jgi:hypothetical protein
MDMDLPGSQGVVMGRCLRAMRTFSIEHLWALVTLAGIFIFLSTHPIRPHDFWWHAKAGEEIVTTGRIPAVDTFSHTVPGSAYRSYQSFWLMELLLYGVYSLGGSALVVFVHSMIITVAYGLLFWLCLWLSGNWRVAALCTLFAAALGLNDWNVRPQAIAPLLAVAMLWVIYGVRVRENIKNRSALGLWWLVPLFLCMVVWVNSHGSFFVGLVLIASWLVDEVWQLLKSRLAGEGWGRIGILRAPCLALMVAALACLINPRGTGIVAYLGTIGGDPVIQNLVPEWMPPSFASLHGSLFLMGLLLSATVLALSSRQPTFFQMVTFLAFAALGLKTLRGVIWFGIVLAPVLANHLPDLAQQAKGIAKKPARSQTEGQAALFNYAFAALILLGLILSLPWFKSRLGFLGAKAGLLSAETPVAATEFLLQNELPGHLFHDMSFGSYLIWAAQPEYPVFVDSRIELYPAGIWQDYLEISAARGDWEASLAEYGVGALMLRPDSQGPLVEAASRSPMWQLVYEDNSTTVFARASSPGVDSE